jgi:hypothetical protein
MNFHRRWIQFAAIAVLAGAATTSAEEAVPNSSEAPVKNTAAVSAPADPLMEMVEKAIQATHQRRLTAGVHTPWQVVHGILAERWELSLLKKERPGEEISGIEWIMSGVTFDGQPLWEATPHGGRGHPFTRPYAFEGHPTQFMGYMTMANIPPEYEIRTPTKVITIRDIINDANMQVHEGVEITWTLWALAHYEEPDAQWFNAAGEPWSIERLVRLQIDEPVTSGACGGCHGLFALAYARNIYLSYKKPLRGVWFEADQKIKQYIQLAQALQNSDGSFSTKHFVGPEYSDDFATRIATSGHQLEWLMIALPQSKLKEQWVRNAIGSVARDLVNNRHVASDCGPLFHGMHALVVYRQRTVPGYLVPKFNSDIKLSERGKKKDPARDVAKSKLSSPKEVTQPKLGADDVPKVVPAGQQSKPDVADPSASSKTDAESARK